MNRVMHGPVKNWLDFGGYPDSFADSVRKKSNLIGAETSDGTFSLHVNVTLQGALIYHNVYRNLANYSTARHYLSLN